MKMNSWKESGVDDRGKKTDEQVESCRGFPCPALDNLEQYVCTMQGARQIHFQGYPSMAFFGCFPAWACLMLMAPTVYTTPTMVRTREPGEMRHDRDPGLHKGYEAAPKRIGARRNRSQELPR